MAKIKNIATGGRGMGVADHGVIDWEPGEIKDVDDALVAKAKKDPANAALLGDGGDLVVMTEAPAERDASDAAKVDEGKTKGAKK